MGPVDVGARLYRWLLRVLPRDFRREFGEEMCRVVEDHWREIQGDAGIWRSSRFWWRQTVAVVRTAVTLRMGRGSGGDRAFDASDDARSRPVIIVNRTLARRHFGDEADAVGEHLVITGGGGTPVAREIVGVVADVRPGGFESEPRPQFYRPFAQAPSGSLTFILHASGDPVALTDAARNAVWEVNASQSVWGVATLEALLADWLGERRFNLLMLGGFSVIALLLAAVGIYGLVSFSVEQRVAELGIRRALGGRSADLLAMVLREGATLAATGVALGVVGSLFLTRVLRGMLYGVEPTDPATFGALALAVMAVTLLAVLLPALRAVHVDPMRALRSE